PAAHSAPHSSLEVAGPTGEFLTGTWGAPWRGGRKEIGGPSLMTLVLGADRNAAHCAPISFGPTRYSPSRLLPSAVSFTVATGLPPSGKKSLHPPHTRLRTRLSKWRPQRVNFERERRELPGGTVEQKLGAPL